EGVRRTATMPDKLSRNVSRLRAEAASSSTTTAIIKPISNVTAATPRKLPRQPIVAVEKASGAVASSAPSVPIPTCMPATVAKRTDGNRRASSASEATNKPAVPNPSSARPKVRTPGLAAHANTTAPMTVRGADHQTNPRAEAVERHAERNLDGGERQKEDARQ